MEKYIDEYIKKQNLANKNEAIVIALSGGIDSMVLFHCLYNLGYKLIVCHVNHKVRPESDMEYEEIKKLCDCMHVPFYGLILDKIEGKNFHDEARSKRYDFFKKIALESNTKTIATAHHLDDLVETILMKLVRGSNLLGYAGIKPLVKSDGFQIIRPLLCVNRCEIASYANEKKITYYEDSSNQTDHYTRNRYRHYIIPKLKEENPNLYQEFINFSNQASNAFSYIRKNSLDLYNKWNQKININEFNKADEAIKRDIISLMLEEKKINNISLKIDSILDIIYSDGFKEIDLGQGYFFKKSYNDGFIEEKQVNIPYEIVINDYGTYNLPNGDQIIFTKKKEFSNYNYINICYNNTMSLPLIVRSRREGDVIHFDYGTKKLKRHLIDKKIPLYLRDIIPVVLNNKKEIIGVIGIGPKKEDSEAYLYWIRRTQNEK